MKNAPTQKLRCAIYTRKSTEEGLAKEFNSLDAQREACEAYIVSQKALGWLPVGDRYEDGGYSGGNLERPALKRLLADIELRKVDVVLVYKLDRISRSLMDFAKLVEVFESHQITFVSVTQSFNTTSSMGRLTLNMLLSFAQFEREVIGERTRDKIAASRRKGMWMGGNVPLGYDAKDRKLVTNKAEAAWVRTVFERFVQTGSVTRMLPALHADGLRTKRGKPPTRAISTSSSTTGSISVRPFTKGSPIPASTRRSSTAKSGTGFIRCCRRARANVRQQAGRRHRHC